MKHKHAPNKPCGLNDQLQEACDLLEHYQQAHTDDTVTRLASPNKESGSDIYIVSGEHREMFRQFTEQCAPTKARHVPPESPALDPLSQPDVMHAAILAVLRMYGYQFGSVEAFVEAVQDNPQILLDVEQHVDEQTKQTKAMLRKTYEHCRQNQVPQSPVV